MNQQKLLLFSLFTALLSLSLQVQTPNEPRQLQSCEPGCLTCSSSEICTDCESTRVLLNGKCRCEAPRILMASNCECPWYMTENPDTQICEYIDLIDVFYNFEVSPLFDAILQAQVNPKLKWTAPPTFTWTVDCNMGNSGLKSQLNDYLTTQKSDILIIPSRFLEYELTCNGKVSYNNQNALEVSKKFHFMTTTTVKPQIQIIGGPFQMLSHSEINLIQVEYRSIAGPEVDLSGVEISWDQRLSENPLDINQIYSSSNPLRLTIPKCMLTPGKVYNFRVFFKFEDNQLLAFETRQTVTIAVPFPEISLQAIETNSYHIHTQDLTLTASQFSVKDECKQGLRPIHFLDLLNIKYTWECAIVDLSETNRVLANQESTEILQDSNVIAHHDPLHLFYQSTTSETLTIPSSYFTSHQDSQFIFYLTATVPSKNKTPSIKDFNLFRSTLNIIQKKAYVQIVASKPFIDITISYTNENNCQALSDDTTKITAFPSDPKYTYTWIFNAPIDKAITESYKNWLQIFFIKPDIKVIPQVILQVTDGTNTASAFFTTPFPTSIKTGSLDIYPSVGYSYKTNFFVSTYQSKDEDLPISYQFYTDSKDEPNQMNLMLRKYEPFDYTPAILPPNGGSCSIGVKMTNNLGYSQSFSQVAQLTNRATNLADALLKITQVMDSSKSSTNSYQRLRLISVVLENLQAWETADPDESLKKKSSEFKYSAISEMKDIFLASSSRNDMREIMLNNIKYASEQLFNEDKNWKLYMSIMDNSFQTNSETALLAPGEIPILAGILDNLIYYMKKPGNKIVNPETIWTYSNTLIRSHLASAIPTSGTGSYFLETFYWLSAKKATYCQVLQRVVTPFMYGLDVLFTLKPDQTIPPENCDKLVDFIFMAFRPDYIVPAGTEYKSQTIVAVDLRDSITGESLMKMFDYTLEAHFEFCPEGATSCESHHSAPDGPIFTIHGVFDLKTQIYNTFNQTYVTPSKPGNNSKNSYLPAKQNLKILESAAFWAVIVSSLLFLVLFCWFSTKNSAYCALLGNKNLSQKLLFKKTSLLFWVMHPLIGVFVYNDPKTAKSTRISIYYQRLIVVMAFSTLFSLIYEEKAILRVFIILFNLLTALPINSFLNRIFSWAFSTKNSPKKDLKQSLGLLFSIFFLSMSVACVLIIDSQQDTSSWNKNWAINFAISFIQDFTLTPLISIIIKILLIKSSQKKKGTSKFLTFFLRNFKPIYIFIFENPSSPNETEAQSPTEIASPMSTTRKLLKIPHLNIPPPTLHKLQQKRVFKGRGVSDTEMVNVDSVAAGETLATDVQTLFSEGKAKRVKENSPVKKNFEKMQSANIASAKLSSPRSFGVTLEPEYRASLQKSIWYLRSVSAKELSINCESQFMIAPPDVLSPSHGFSELAIEVRPEDILICSIGSPREMISPRIMKDNKNIGPSLSAQK